MANKLLFLTITLTLFSCTKVIYTHENYMQHFKTKADVVTNFGLPSAKKVEGNYTEFFYDFGQIESESITNQSIVNQSNANNVYSRTLQQDTRFVKFVLNEKDSVIFYKTSYMNFKNKRFQVAKQ